MIPAPRTPKQRRALLREELAMQVRVAGPTLGRLENWMTANGMGLGATYSHAIDRLIELATANAVCADPQPERPAPADVGVTLEHLGREPETVQGYRVGELVTLRGPHGDRYRARVVGPSGDEGLAVDIMATVFSPAGQEGHEMPEPLSGRLCVLPEHLEPFPAGSPAGNARKRSHKSAS